MKTALATLGITMLVLAGLVAGFGYLSRSPQYGNGGSGFYATAAVMAVVALALLLSAAFTGSKKS